MPALADNSIRLAALPDDLPLVIASRSSARDNDTPRAANRLEGEAAGSGSGTSQATVPDGTRPLPEGA
jgi:hypothetical protein